MQTRKKILDCKLLFCTVFAVGLLASCNPSTSAPTTNSEPTTDPTSNPITSIPTTDTTTSDPTSEPSITVSQGSINFDVYTLNDFHGATKYVEDTYPQIGLAKMSTIFNTFAEENTSFFISSGDMWQETIESNSNRGEYVTKAFNKIGLDAMTIGNHEFDWGAEYIVKNALVADYPFLAANIREIETGYLLENTLPSTIVEKDGIKVGIIGTIGPAQYNSISYQQVASYEFENEYKIVVDEANYLREHGADVVILSAHDGYNSSDFGVLKKEMINEAKIDMVIAGHTHKKQSDIYVRNDGQEVPLIQAYSNGTAFGHVNFTFDTETKELEVNSYKVENFKDYAHYEEDPEIIQLYKDNYDVDYLIGEEICELKDNFSDSQVGILAATAIYEKIKNSAEYADFNILTAYHNTGRKSMDKGTLTYEELFLSLPFDNEIIIYEVSSSYTKKGWNYVHSGFDYTKDFSGKRYVAGIDYIAYKTIKLEDGIRTGLYVRDIVEEYLRNKKVVTSSDYVN